MKKKSTYRTCHRQLLTDTMVTKKLRLLARVISMMLIVVIGIMSRKSTS